ncbi:MarR family winged helix-turn-helix transcriptional regulator [Marivirga arenosa]|uniref:MarR family transcriptional regulator n=1 Tax=Marivirga arenosa TaxID=3059076 RepID=A0AA51ZXP1_9BACT|nr:MULTISPECIES: MarR family transcriptional regulator [unclassified Marivirga]WKK83547.2 MarR family transcriptional regulator [Marivirga sp. ABR2-2]WNB18664.1 MarR family transcriptional regulator [Marivirga sp. BKB1-2]
MSGKASGKINPLISQTFSTLLSCQQKMSYEISREMKSYGITRQQYEVLKILDENSDDSMNLNKVKSHLRENVPDISRIVQRLVEKKLINRERLSSDKRNSSISINAEGIKALKEIEPVIKDKMDQFFGVLTSDELNELARIISKVNQTKS